MRGDHEPLQLISIEPTRPSAGASKPHVDRSSLNLHILLAYWVPHPDSSKCSFSSKQTEEMYISPSKSLQCQQLDGYTCATNSPTNRFCTLHCTQYKLTTTSPSKVASFHHHHNNNNYNTAVMVVKLENEVVIKSSLDEMVRRSALQAQTCLAAGGTQLQVVC